MPSQVAGEFLFELDLAIPAVGTVMPPFTRRGNLGFAAQELYASHRRRDRVTILRFAGHGSTYVEDRGNEGRGEPVATNLLSHHRSRKIDPRWETSSPFRHHSQPVGARACLNQPVAVF